MKNIEIFHAASLHIIHLIEHITMVLIRLCRCTGWSTPLLLACNNKIRFFGNEARIGTVNFIKFQTVFSFGACSTVSNMYGNRCDSDCRSRGPEFDPGSDPYFRGD